jgi:hypothetical protein
MATKAAMRKEREEARRRKRWAWIIKANLKGCS